MKLHFIILIILKKRGYFMSETLDINEIKQTVGKRLSEFLKENKSWNKTKLINRSGLNEQIINRCICGTTVTTEHLRTICLTTGLSSDYLLGLSENKNAIDIETDKGVFHYLRYLIENVFIQDTYLEEDALYTYPEIIGEISSILKTHDKLNCLLKDDIENYVDDITKEPTYFRIMDTWMETRKDLFIQHMEKRKPKKIETKKEIKAIISSRLNELMHKNELNTVQLYKKYRDYILDNCHDINDDFLNKINISDQTTLTNYKNGKNIIPIEKIIILSKLFKVTTDYFFGIDGSLDIPPTPGEVFDSIFRMRKRSIIDTRYVDYRYEDHYVFFIVDEIAELFYERYRNIYYNVDLTDSDKNIYYHKIVEDFITNIIPNKSNSTKKPSSLQVGCNK